VIQFIVPAVPVAQPRQRHRVVQSGGRTFTQNYTPSKHPVQSFKATVRMAAQQAYDGPPLNEPLTMRLLFVMDRPGRLLQKKSPPGRIPFCNKNKDWDNLGKSVSDALNGLVYVDDGLLWSVSVEKVFGSRLEAPHVEVTITPSGEASCK
jgi:Holliday junction resolvase RusA-like endonuclease